MTASEEFDLDRYLARLGLDGPPAPTRAGLTALHRAHLAAIPFENLDVRLGRPVGLDLASLQAKLVGCRRGVGFAVDTLEARVRPPGASGPLPRTHMLLRVTLDAGPVLADVGFGGDGPLDPVPFDGAATEAGGDVHRLESERAGRLVLRRRGGDGWIDLYAFGLEPALPVDFAVAHHFTSTHPRSPFVSTLTAQRITEAERLTLRGRTLATRRGAEVSTRELDAAEVLALLTGPFGLEVTAEDVSAALASAS